jgi:hypothetical protein
MTYAYSHMIVKSYNPYLQLPDNKIIEGSPSQKGAYITKVAFAVLITAAAGAAVGLAASPGGAVIGLFIGAGLGYCGSVATIDSKKDAEEKKKREQEAEERAKAYERFQQISRFGIYSIQAQ